MNMILKPSTSSPTKTIMDTICASWSMIIGLRILEAVRWQVTPRTPYYLRKRIQYLQYELIKKTLEVNEEIIRP